MNHLMIGLGGTGGKIIAATRRLMFQHHGSTEPADIAVDYLYIDTSDDDTRVARLGEPLKESDQMWRTLGHSVQLSPSQVMYMPNAGLGGIIESPDEFPRISSWMGDNARWRSYWASRPGEMKAAGQIRRIGRAVLAQNIDRVNHAILTRTDARKSPINEWTVHVFAGLAGGTGSGSFLDIAAQLSKLFQGQAAKTILYAVLPEAQDSAWATGNYHGNGYAALVELNAALVDRLELTDLADEHGRKLSLAGITNTFIITNQNQQRYQVDLERTLPQIAAEAFYQIVVASGDARVHGTEGQGQAGTDQRAWRDEITGENRDILYEKDDQENPTAPPFDRANRFISFGIKRIAVPHQEVREYSSLVFMRQFVLQSLNNAWVEGEGYSPTRRPFGATEHVKNQANKEKWLMTDQHLMLERKLLVNDPDRWSRLSEDFSRAINGKVSEITTAVRDKMDWPRTLEDFVREFFEQKFRTFGVAAFYNNSLRSVEDRARFIVRDTVGSDLFQKWRIGELSINDIRRVVEELIVDTAARNEAANEAITKASAKAVEATEAYARKRAEYNSKGMFAVGYNRTRALEMMGGQLADRYTADSYVIARGFQQKMLGAIHALLLELRLDIETMAERFEETLESIEPQIVARLDVKAQNVPQSHQYKFYDPEHIRTLLSRFEQNQKMQEDQTAAMREKMVSLLGAQPSFGQFRNVVTKGMIRAELEAVAEQRAADALADTDNERDRVLEASIIQKLYEEYGNRPEELRRFFADRVAEAQPFAALDQGEMNRGRGIRVRHSVVAFLPSKARLSSDHLRQFHDQLRNALADASPNGRVHVSETSNQTEQIVILSLVSQYPLRALSALPFLKTKYDEICKGPRKDYVPIHLYLEGSGEGLPSLFALGSDEYRKQAAPYWLIAECMGLLTERPHPQTGRPEVIIRFVDMAQDGDLRIVKIGDSLAARTATLGVSEALMLMKVVKAELVKVVHIDDRRALRAKLGEIRNAALEKAGFDEANPGFAQIAADVATARAIVGD